IDAPAAAGGKALAGPVGVERAAAGRARMGARRNTAGDQRDRDGCRPILAKHYVSLVSAHGAKLACGVKRVLSQETGKGSTFLLESTYRETRWLRAARPALHLLTHLYPERRRKQLAQAMLSPPRVFRPLCRRKAYSFAPYSSDSPRIANRHELRD